MLTFMLDTNIAIYVLKKRPANALKSFNQYSGQMCISSITLAELMHGEEKALTLNTTCDKLKISYRDCRFLITESMQLLTMAIFERRWSELASRLV